jgi:hypothetical protein
MVWSEEVGLKVVDISFIPNFVDEIRWIFV